MHFFYHILNNLHEAGLPINLEKAKLIQVTVLAHEYGHQVQFNSPPSTIPTILDHLIVNLKIIEMKTKIICIVLLNFILSCGENDNEITNVNIPTENFVKTTSSAFYQDLVFHHAPIFYQDVDPTGSHGIGGKADYITAYDFDGDLTATNNWNNIANNIYKGNAVSYYSVTETASHYYIIYSFFHPRDWTDILFLYFLDEHENDMEGILTIVEKDASTYGKVQAVVTTFHNDFYSYKYPGSVLTDGSENIDGTLSTQADGAIIRYEVSSQAKGHGIKSYQSLKPGGNDYLVYYPSKTMSESPADVFDRDVKYTLVDIFQSGGMWDEKSNASLMINNGAFKSSYGNGNANTPWGWDDYNDGSAAGSAKGDISKYPADFADLYFNGFPSMSKTYIHNLYLGIN